MSVALGALGRDTVLKTAPLLTLTDGGTLIKSRTYQFIRDIDVNDGPFLVGVAGADLDVNEIAGYYILDGPQGLTHKAANEIVPRGRHIRTLGYLNPSEIAAGGVIAGAFDILTKLGFHEDEGGYDYFIMNLGNDLVTGSTWEVTHEDFVIWD